MNDFISKPFSPESLFPVVARWATAGRAPRAPATKVLPDPPESQDIVLPATLPGLDIQEGLDRVAGDRTLYCWLLRHFPEKYTAADQRIRALLTEGKSEDALREAHTIKGLAGQIGAHDLFQAGGRLEAALESASPDLEAALQSFANSLSQMTRGLAGFSENEARSVPPDSENAATRPVSGNKEVDRALP
jgi:two-component system sensor histidine kinase/response regulator